jgi:hypothetical protein
MEKRDQKPVKNPAPAVQSVAEILVSVLLRRLTEDREATRAEKA